MPVVASSRVCSSFLFVSFPRRPGASLPPVRRGGEKVEGMVGIKLIEEAWRTKADLKARKKPYKKP